MDEIIAPLLLDLRSKVPPETWQTRLANARAWALVCEGILARQAEGMALGTAIRKAAPDHLVAPPGTVPAGRLAGPD